MKQITFLTLIITICFSSLAQQINGDFNLSLQSYQEDEKIGAPKIDEIILNNSYLNLNYT